MTNIKQQQENVLYKVITSIFRDLFFNIFIKKDKKKNKDGEVVEEKVGSNTFRRTKKGVLNIAIKELREHSFIVGSSGSGKSVLLKRIIRQFLKIQNKFELAGEEYLRKNTKIIIHDTKLDFTQEFYNEKNWIIVNPFDERGYGFNVFRFIKSKTDIERFCRNLSPKSEKGEPIWSNSTVDILSAIMATCIEKGTMTNADILHYIKMDYEKLAYAITYLVRDEHGQLVLNEKGKPIRVPYEGAEFGYTHLVSSQAGNLYSNFISNMTFFKSFASCERELNVEDYIRNDGRNLLLVNPDKLKASLSPIHTILLAEISTIILDLEEDPARNLVFILDEFSSLQKSEAILDLLKLGRSFGAILFIGIQEFAPLKTMFEEQMETFKNNTKNKFFFSINSPETQKEISQMIGTQELKMTNDSNSSGIEANKDGISSSTQRIEKVAVIDTEIASLIANEFYFVQRRAVEKSETGETLKFIGKIQGGIDTTVDTREKIAVGFIPREDLLMKKVINHFKEIDGKQDKKTEIKETQTVIKEEKKVYTQEELEKKEQYKKSLKEKLSNSLKENEKISNKDEIVEIQSYNNDELEEFDPAEHFKALREEEDNEDGTGAFDFNLNDLSDVNTDSPFK